METAEATAPHLTFGQRLRVSRERLGLTVRDVAAALPGISMSAVATWERGVSEPSVGRVAKLAKFYGVDVRWLIEGIDTDDVPTTTEAFACVGGRHLYSVPCLGQREFDFPPPDAPARARLVA
jgi:transcriptional regulator with XRE-family HTH domain